MRQVAFLTLFLLGSLNAASLSALHIDAAQSHAALCAPQLPAPDCHADLPHEHEATHAGEESLFEYIFGQSREAGLAIVMILALLYSSATLLIAPTLFWAQKLCTVAPIPICCDPAALRHSRAPPFPL